MCCGACWGYRDILDIDPRWRLVLDLAPTPCYERRVDGLSGPNLRNRRSSGVRQTGLEHRSDAGQSPPVHSLTRWWQEAGAAGRCLGSGEAPSCQLGWAGRPTSTAG